jgi:hypothetical protein
MQNLHCFRDEEVLLRRPLPTPTQDRGIATSDRSSPTAGRSAGLGDRGRSQSRRNRPDPALASLGLSAGAGAAAIEPEKRRSNHHRLEAGHLTQGDGLQPEPLFLR